MFWYLLRAKYPGENGKRKEIYLNLFQFQKMSKQGAGKFLGSPIFVLLSPMIFLSPGYFVKLF